MFASAPVFGGFSVDDISRALDFYGRVLGLDVAEVPLGVAGPAGAAVPTGMEIRSGGRRVALVYPRPGHVPATFTVLNILVPDIDAAVDLLTARGVRLEHYEVPRTDAKGIHRDPSVHPTAWLRDPAGNVVSLVESRA
jgi:catechol 2,3-dioxygenase-like lactoylglutathione lyase family enzyme